MLSVAFAVMRPMAAVAGAMAVFGTRAVLEHEDVLGGVAMGAVFMAASMSAALLAAAVPMAAVA